MRDASFLTVSNLNVSYGAAPAVRDASLRVAQGEVTVVVGPNGAGKTTLINALAGLHRPISGKITVQGDDVTSLPSHRYCDAGIALVPEGRRLFTGMTVLENLELGSYRRAARAQRASGLEAVLALFPVLRERRQQLAGSLSGGEQQMLALGRGLMAQPDLLLLDEPSQGLGPRIVEQIFETIDRIRKSRRLTILLVEQRVVEALELCDRGYVLETGRVVLEGAHDALLADPRVQRAYLGV